MDQSRRNLLFTLDHSRRQAYPPDIERKYEALSPPAWNNPATYSGDWTGAGSATYKGWATANPKPYGLTTDYSYAFSGNPSPVYCGGFIPFENAIHATDANGVGVDNFQLLMQMNVTQCGHGIFFPSMYTTGGFGAIHFKGDGDLTTYQIGLHDGSATTYSAAKSSNFNWTGSAWNWARLWYNNGVVSLRTWRNTLANEPGTYSLLNHDLKTDPDFTGHHPGSWSVWRLQISGAQTGYTCYVRPFIFNVYFGRGTPS